MWHYLLLFVSALTLLACPSKPQRRAPAVIDNSSDAVFKGAGLHLALLHDASGYRPIVLRISASGAVMPVEVSKAYSSGGVYSLKQEQSKAAHDLSVKDTQAINLLLAFEEGGNSYCVTTPLAGVLKWVKGVDVTVIKQKLVEASASPLNVSTSKGTLEQQTGGWRCTGV